MTPNAQEQIESIPQGLLKTGFRLVPRGDGRRFKNFGTWERSGVRVALSSHKLYAESNGDVILYEGDDEAMTIQALLVDKGFRNKGLAKKALEDVSKFADSLSLTLFLEPAPLEEGISKNRLQLLYESLGFVADSSGNVMQRKPKNTEVDKATNFKLWSEGAPLIGATQTLSYQGGPVVFEAFHGTTHPNINEFDSSVGRPDGALGKGIYATTGRQDASANYAGIGADLKARVEDLIHDLSTTFYDDNYVAHQILADYFREENISADITEATFESLRDQHAENAIRSEAVRQMKGDSDGLVMPVYIKFRNPFDIRKNGLKLFRNIDTDDNGEMVPGSEAGSAIDFLRSLERVGSEFSVDISDLHSEIWTECLENDSITAFDIWQLAKRWLNVDYDIQGESASVGEFMQSVARDAGFDGIIQDADYHFGSGRRGFGGTRIDSMEGVVPGTLHLMPFDGTQVKSALGNNGQYDKNTADIRHSFAGQKAKTANNQLRLNAAERIRSGESPEAVRQATGWFLGVDGQWRFEISDHNAKLFPAIKTLSSGGYGQKWIKSVTYKVNSDQTFDICLAPPNPKYTTEFVTLTHISEDALRSSVPLEVFNEIKSGSGEDDYIGNFEDGKRIAGEFNFEGFNALPLDQVIEHPALFLAYPALRNILVQVDPKLRLDAAFHLSEDGDHIIRIGTGQQLTAILHEIQHGIQFIEGFARGGSVDSVSDLEAATLRAERLELAKSDVETSKALYSQEPTKENLAAYENSQKALLSIDTIAKESDRLEFYRRLSGEVEARNTQSRQALNDIDRLKTAPSSTADVPDQKTIVRNQSIESVATVSSMGQAISNAIGIPSESIRKGPGGFMALTSRQIQNTWTAPLPFAHAHSELALENARLIQAASRKTAQAFFDPKTRTTYFIADRIAKGTETAVFLHEIIHKHGQAALPPGSWNSLVAQVKDWRGHAASTHEHQIYTAAFNRASSSGSSAESFDEELFAYAVEEAINQGIKPSASAVDSSAEKWLSSVISSIQNIGLKLTGKTIGELAPQDLVDLAYALAQLENPKQADKVRHAIRQFLSIDPPDTRAFRAWFRDSKVVDSENRPKVLYHGTGNDFETFKGGAMIWGSVDPILADQYALCHDSSVVMPLFMRACNPFFIDNERQEIRIRQLLVMALDQAQSSGIVVELDDAKAGFDAIVKHWQSLNFANEPVRVHHHWALSGHIGFCLLRDYFNTLGFDSIEIEESGVKTYGVFDRRAVKSASANQGTWDSNDPRIRYSDREDFLTLPSTETIATQSRTDFPKQFG